MEIKDILLIIVSILGIIAVIAFASIYKKYRALTTALFGAELKLGNKDEVQYLDMPEHDANDNYKKMMQIDTAFLSFLNNAMLTVSTELPKIEDAKEDIMYLIMKNTIDEVDDTTIEDLAKVFVFENGNFIDVSKDMLSYLSIMLVGLGGLTAGVAAKNLNE